MHDVEKFDRKSTRVYLFICQFLLLTKYMLAGIFDCFCLVNEYACIFVCVHLQAIQTINACETKR